MNALFDLICGTGFMPHGQCYLWTPTLIWLHAVSDSLIALAYFSIPLSLLHFVRRRRDIPYPGLFLMFGGFIVACGATHLFEVWTIWHSQYYLTGGVKAFTAAISLTTAFVLVRIMPQALQLTGPTELRRLNESLEERVRLRTIDLEAVNTSLRREVGERQKAEAEVHRLNELLQRRVDELQALFNVLPVGVGIAEDRECRTIRTNAALARMLGLALEANASLTAPGPTVPHNFHVKHQGALLPPAELPMQRCARENVSVVDFEETIVRSDGITLDVLANAVPLHGSDGQPIGCVATFQDVTTLKAALAASAHYAAIVESSDDAIIGETLDGVVTTCNPAAEKMFGYSAAELTGRSLMHLVPEHRQAEEKSMLERVRRGETVPAFESIRQHKNGRLLDVSVSHSPIRDAASKMIGISVAARDITARKETEARHREMDRKIQETQKLESLGVLAGGIAHDFNNLLTGILGNVSLARAEVPPTSEIVAFLQQIDHASRRAADLCKQMLAYSGRGRFVVQRLDLNQLVTDTTQLLTISIGKNCTLRFNLAPNLPAITADATQIRQIVMNLVINASEAIGPRAGTVSLNTSVAHINRDFLRTLRHDSGLVPGNHVVLEVSDTGCGMDAATLARIFEPFFTTKFTGRGLGLAAVLGIVRGHKGGLKVYSEPGRGTTFKLLLPCQSEPQDTAELIADPAPAVRRGTGHVLVVDDEETVRHVSGQILRSIGYTAELAASGEEALERYRSAPANFSLVLLDLTMPNLDGEETFRQLRQVNPAVRVVLMSGFNEQEAIARFTGKGLAGFVQKPFDVASLAAAVHGMNQGR